LTKGNQAGVAFFVGPRFLHNATERDRSQRSDRELGLGGIELADGFSPDDEQDDADEDEGKAQTSP
jgi:hypothetical protein